MSRRTNNEPDVRRIAVALDPACATPGILEAAADLAAALGAELEVLFVEDVDIRSLSRLPFGRLFEPASGKIAPFDEAALAARRAGPLARHRTLLRQISKTRRLTYSVRDLGGRGLAEVTRDSAAELLVVASFHGKFGGLVQTDPEALAIAAASKQSVLLLSPHSISPDRILLIADDSAPGRRAARMASLLTRRSDASGGAPESLSAGELTGDELAARIHARTPSLVVLGVGDDALAARVRDSLRHETCSLLMVR